MQRRVPVLLYVYHGPEKRPERRRYLPDKNSYPLQKGRRGQYKIRCGEMLWVCMTSDFFLPEADPWRDDAWDMIRMRPDVIFFLLTKRPQRVSACLPEDWGNGWENVFFHVACENQIRAEERIPFLLSLPFRHKGVFCTPLLGPISLRFQAHLQWMRGL